MTGSGAATSGRVTGTGSAHGPISVRRIRPRDLDDALVDQWRELVATSIEANPYMAPAFVLPALKHLSGDADVQMVLATRPAGGDGSDAADRPELCGLALVLHARPNTAVPVPHLEIYKTKHSAMSGLLLDASDPVAICRALVEELHGSQPRALALRFSNLHRDGPVADALRTVSAERGFHWTTLIERSRAVLDVGELRAAEHWGGHISSGRRKNLRRSARRLGDGGELTWVMKKGSEVTWADMEDFLRLENLGWKGDQQSSLLASQANEDFFVDAAQAFLDEEALLTSQLKIDDEVVAATCHFMVGAEGFAFKLGWDPRLKQHSPGVVNEMMFLEHVYDSDDDFAIIDSSAAEGSFIDTYWPGRRTMTSGIISFDSRGRAAVGLAKAARLFKESATARALALRAEVGRRRQARAGGDDGQAKAQGGNGQ